MRRLDEATCGRARGRGDHPDRRRVDVLLPRHVLYDGARLRAGGRMVRPHRRVRRAVRQQLHARLLSRRVRGGADVARAGGRRRRAELAVRGGRLLSLPACLGRCAAARARGAETSAGTTGGGSPAPRRSRPAGRQGSAGPDWLSTEVRRSGQSSSWSASCASSRTQVVERAPALEILVHARVARGELEEARTALENCVSPSSSSARWHLPGGADRAEGALAAARGDHDAGETTARGRRRGYERSGAPYEAARADQLATSLVALGRKESAAREASAALDRCAELGAETEAQRARRMLASDLPARSASSRHASARCCALLAEGLTNRAIAERLVVSEHTVHRHVTNILRKLDVPSRTAAAALAVRAGLPARAGA